MVKIISDSTCDLTPDLLSKYDIDILPLHILLGEKEYKDGINITPDQIYSWSDANKTTPKTSAPALSETIELFRPYVEEGRNIVCFSISNSMSSSGNVMQLAAEELNAQDLITVIDSANLSTGIGLLVIEAAILAQNNIKKVECLEYPELGMEAIWKIEVEDFPAFILVDDKGNDFFKQIKPRCSCPAK